MNLYLPCSVWPPDLLVGGGLLSYPGNAENKFEERVPDIILRWLTRVKTWKVSFRLDYDEVEATGDPNGLPRAWSFHDTVEYVTTPPCLDESHLFDNFLQFSGYVGPGGNPPHIVAQTDGDPRWTADFGGGLGMNIFGVKYISPETLVAEVRVLLTLQRNVYVDGNIDEYRYVVGLQLGTGTPPPPPDPDNPPADDGSASISATPKIDTLDGNPLYGYQLVSKPDDYYHADIAVSEIKFEPHSFWSWGGRYDEGTGLEN